MGKKKEGHIPYKHLHSRMSFLHQAANYMYQVSKDIEDSRINDVDNLEAVHAPQTSTVKQEINTHESSVPANTLEQDSQVLDKVRDTCVTGHGQSRRLSSQLRAVSLKGQVRLSTSIKHSICRHCESPLVPGSTSSSEIENRSKGGRKPWADVLVVTCLLCGTTRRVPVGAKRHSKRKDRLEQLNSKT